MALRRKQRLPLPFSGGEQGLAHSRVVILAQPESPYLPL
jgi:hypothetical protein